MLCCRGERGRREWLDSSGGATDEHKGREEEDVRQRVVGGLHASSCGGELGRHMKACGLACPPRANTNRGRGVGWTGVMLSKRRLPPPKPHVPSRCTHLQLQYLVPQARHPMPLVKGGTGGVPCCRLRAARRGSSARLVAGSALRSVVLSVSALGQRAGVTVVGRSAGMGCCTCRIDFAIGLVIRLTSRSPVRNNSSRCFQIASEAFNGHPSQSERVCDCITHIAG